MQIASATQIYLRTGRTSTTNTQYWLNMLLLQKSTNRSVHTILVLLWKRRSCSLAPSSSANTATILIETNTLYFCLIYLHTLIYLTFFHSLFFSIVMLCRLLYFQYTAQPPHLYILPHHRELQSHSVFSGAASWRPKPLCSSTGKTKNCKYASKNSSHHIIS